MGCPRCGGLVYRMRDPEGKGLQCFVCAWIRWDMRPQTYDEGKRSPRHTPGTAARYMERKRANRRERYARERQKAGT